MPLTTVTNGAGQEVLAYVPGMEVVNDDSNVIAASNTSQLAIAAPVAPALRSGWQLQNQGVHPMYVNDLGLPAVEGSALNAGNIVVAQGQSVGTLPGCTFQVPLTAAAINIIGTAGDAYLARDW